MNVYYEKLSYEHIKEIPAVSSSSLLGTVGGTLGLFVGLSIISLFEFVEYFIKMIIYACCKPFKKVKPKREKKVKHKLQQEVRPFGELKIDPIKYIT